MEYATNFGCFSVDKDALDTYAEELHALTSGIVNRETGAAPTSQEMEQIKRRAMEIFANPYASPEQMEWAITVHPEGLAEIVVIEPTIYRKHRA